MYKKTSRVRVRVHPSFWPYSQDDLSQVFFYMRYPILRCYHARCVDVFVEDENACEAAWAVHVSKIHVTELAISGPS